MSSCCVAETRTSCACHARLGHFRFIIPAHARARRPDQAPSNQKRTGFFAPAPAVDVTGTNTSSNSLCNAAEDKAGLDESARLSPHLAWLDAWAPPSVPPGSSFPGAGRLRVRACICRCPSACLPSRAAPHTCPPRPRAVLFLCLRVTTCLCLCLCLCGAWTNCSLARPDVAGGPVSLHKTRHGDGVTDSRRKCR